MENNLKNEAKSVLHRITSPWFFTFIPWWVVFNYDFLLRIFGKFETVDKINHHYCMADSIRYTIAGCIPQMSVGFWHWAFYTPWVTKLAFPILATVFSMTVVAWFISLITDLHHKISNKQYRYKWLCEYIESKYDNTTRHTKDGVRNKQEEMLSKLRKWFWKTK